MEIFMGEEVLDAVDGMSFSAGGRWWDDGL